MLAARVQQTWVPSSVPRIPIARVLPSRDHAVHVVNISMWLHIRVVEISIIEIPHRHRKTLPRAPSRIYLLLIRDAQAAFRHVCGIFLVSDSLDVVRLLWPTVVNQRVARQQTRRCQQRRALPDIALRVQVSCALCTGLVVYMFWRRAYIADDFIAQRGWVASRLLSTAATNSLMIGFWRFLRSAS